MGFGDFMKDVGDHFRTYGDTYANLGKFAAPIARGIGAYGEYKTTQ